MITPDEIPGSDRVARHYDDLDLFYREVWGERVHHGLWSTGHETAAEAVEQLVHVIAERAGIEPGMRVCDVGCGYGGTSRLLATRYQAIVTGLTISGAQYRYAVERTNGSDNPRFLLCNWEHNQFHPESLWESLVPRDCQELHE